MLARFCEKICLAISLTFILALGMSGCSRKKDDKIVVQGRITKNGVPLKIKESEGIPIGKIQVKFYPLELKEDDEQKTGSEKVASGSSGVNKEGNYQTTLPPGKYKVCISWKDDPVLGEDLLKGEFSFEKSKIIREIKGAQSNVELNFDVSRPEG